MNYVILLLLFLIETLQFVYVRMWILYMGVDRIIIYEWNLKIFFFV